MVWDSAEPGVGDGVGGGVKDGVAGGVPADPAWASEVGAEAGVAVDGEGLAVAWAAVLAGTLPCPDAGDTETGVEAASDGIGVSAGTTAHVGIGTMAAVGWLIASGVLVGTGVSAGAVEIHDRSRSGRGRTGERHPTSARHANADASWSQVLALICKPSRMNQ